VVNNLLEQIHRRRKPEIETEVDEELRFHIDMQTHDYEGRGLSSENSRVMAEARFGDVERIRKECIRIGSGKPVLIWVLSSVFLMSLLIGLLLRALVPEMHVNRVGDVMMMIGGLGILLVYAKRAGTTVFTSKSESFRLGLNNSPPVSFDEQGRTPFDRVRSDE
jgi:hypothetical protein